MTYTPAFDLPESGFYMEDTRQRVGNSMMFWRVGNAGYTSNLLDAAVFSADQLDGFRDTDRAWPVEYINARCKPTVDFQYCDYGQTIAKAEGKE